MNISFPQYLESSFYGVIKLLNLAKPHPCPLNISLKFTDESTPLSLEAFVLKFFGLLYDHVRTTISPFRYQYTTDIEFEKEVFLIFLEFIICDFAETLQVYSVLAEIYGKDFLSSYSSFEKNPINDCLINLINNK